GLVLGPHLDGLVRVGRPQFGDPSGEPVKATPAAAPGWRPWGVAGGAPEGRTRAGRATARRSGGRPRRPTGPGRRLGPCARSTARRRAGRPGGRRTTRPVGSE